MRRKTFPRQTKKKKEIISINDPKATERLKRLLGKREISDFKITRNIRGNVYIIFKENEVRRNMELNPSVREHREIIDAFSHHFKKK